MDPPRRDLRQRYVGTTLREWHAGMSLPAVAALAMHNICRSTTQDRRPGQCDDCAIPGRDRRGAGGTPRAPPARSPRSTTRRLTGSESGWSATGVLPRPAARPRSTAPHRATMASRQRRPGRNADPPDSLHAQRRHDLERAGVRPARLRERCGRRPDGDPGERSGKRRRLYAQCRRLFSYTPTANLPASTACLQGQ